MLVTTLILIYSCCVLYVSGRVECFSIDGRIRCPSDPSKVSSVRIDLMDEDPLPLELDDTMGRTWTRSDGTFTISGCGSDFGPLNTPDGYLKIFHECPHRENRSIPGPLQIDVLPIYMPNRQRIGTIYLDRYFDDVTYD